MQNDERPNHDILAEFAPITKRLSKDLREAAKNLSQTEARFLVDSYYNLQRTRIREENRVRSLTASGEPTLTISFMREQARTLEDYVKVSLDVYSSNHPVGAWARSNAGIGPVIAAGLLGYIDITKALYAGQIWSYAGLVPGKVWEKGKPRPWNAQLKTLCWKIGESFVKISGQEEPNYGHVYKQRKLYEQQMNEAGKYAPEAHRLLGIFNIQNEGVRELLSSGKLVPAHIHARAKRYTVKLFLSHLHEVWYTFHYNQPAPKAYVLDHLGHHRYIPPMTLPDWMPKAA